VIAPDNVAENRPISTGPSDDEETVVTSGLKSGERVVVRGQYRLRPGVKVDAHDAEATVAKTIAP
jgi:multidrug efflux pump subunit AcrA (membrane-fusion protein)